MWSEAEAQARLEKLRRATALYYRLFHKMRWDHPALKRAQALEDRLQARFDSYIMSGAMEL